MGRFRFLHCVETVGSGGVEQRRLTLTRGLDAATYDQALVCTQAIGGLPTQFWDANRPIHEVGALRGIYDWRPYYRTLRVIRQYGPHTAARYVRDVDELHRKFTSEKFHGVAAW